MLLVAIALPLTEIALLLFGAIIFCIALRFFIETRRSLQEVLSPKSKQTSSPPLPGTTHRQNIYYPKSKPAQDIQKPWLFGKPKPVKEEPVRTFKENTPPPQKVFNSFLENASVVKEEEHNQLHKEIAHLEKMVAKKEEALQKAKQETHIAQQKTTHIDELHKELGWQQRKIAELEKKAEGTANLTAALEEAYTLQEQLQQELHNNKEKTEQVLIENQRLHEQVTETENKLAEANLHRKQLLKKVQLMHDVNEDLQNVTETNKKFKTDLRRIGELESMLNIIQEERDILFKGKLR